MIEMETRVATLEFQFQAMDSKLDLILQEGRNTRKIIEKNGTALNMLAKAVGANARAIGEVKTEVAEVKTIVLKSQE